MSSFVYVGGSASILNLLVGGWLYFLLIGGSAAILSFAYGVISAHGLAIGSLIHTNKGWSWEGCLWVG